MTDNEIAVALRRIIAAYALPMTVPEDPDRASDTAREAVSFLRGVANRIAGLLPPPGRMRELFLDDGTPAGAHLCTACQRIYDTPWPCCEPQLCECGAPRAKNRTCCDACLRAHDLAAEERRWAAATEKPADGYDDPVYVVTEDGDTWGRYDGHFGSVEWLNDSLDTWRFDHPGEPTPVLHVYATKARKMSLDSSIVESALDDFHEDAIEEITDEGMAELDSLLAAWVEKHSPTTYDPDTKTKLVGWERPAEPEE